MRTLVHLSDLHFGRVDAPLVAPLARRVHALAPSVVVVSGDLTQRARPAQFREARRFLDSLPGVTVVVPGNHDVPLYNLYLRFLRPLARYRRYIAADAEPAYVDDEIAVIGINTARSAVFKGGRISRAQIERLRAGFCAVDARVTKVVVTHHPFDLPPAYHRRQLVGRARRAMAMFAQCGADILLAGHLHASHAGDTATRYKIGDYAALVVQAGTATSTRGRGEANSFNALRLAAGRVEVTRYAWTGRDFAAAGTETFERSATGWQRR